MLHLHRLPLKIGGAIPRHEHELTANNRIIYDESALKFTSDAPAFLAIAFEKLAQEQGGSKIMANTVATGAVLGLLGMKLDLLLEFIADLFRQKGDAVVEANKKAAQAGFHYAKEHGEPSTFVAAADNVKPRMLIGGVEAIASGPETASISAKCPIMITGCGVRPLGGCRIIIAMP